jgi:hypothetical protein
MTQRRNKEEKKDFRMSLLVSLPNHHDETDEEQGEQKRFIAIKLNIWDKTKNKEEKKDFMQTKSTPEKRLRTRRKEKILCKPNQHLRQTKNKEEKKD